MGLMSISFGVQFLGVSSIFMILSSFLFYWGNYLNGLLILEGLMLVSFFFLNLKVSSLGIGFDLVLLFITMLISAGTYGLCLLICYSRGGLSDRLNLSVI